MITTHILPALNAMPVGRQFRIGAGARRQLQGRLMAAGRFPALLDGLAALGLWRVFAAFGICAAIFQVLPLTTGDGGLRTGELVTLWWTGSVMLLALRAGWLAWTKRQRRLAHRRVLIVGTGPLARRAVQALSNDTGTSFDIVGFVDTPADGPVDPAIALRTLGALEHLESILLRDDIDEVFIALPVKSRYREIQQSLSTCERIGVPSRYRADFFHADVAWPRYEPGADPIVTMQVTQDGYPVTVKRVMDVCATGILLAMLAPLMAVIAAVIKLTDGGPAFFSQERYGLNRRRFRMLKFRTMVANAESLQASLESLNEADGPTFKIANDPRVTAFGRMLRRTSLDELPQLFNVMRGEMSLVGPRPLPVRDVARFTDGGDMRRFSVRPGLTCLWQVSGRSNLSFTEWMRLDLTYIDTWSLGLDVLILARTVPAVLRGTGAH